MLCDIARDVARKLPLLLAVLLLAGCDSSEDDLDAESFNGTWRLVEAGSRTTDFSALLLSRFDAVLVTFVSEEGRFILLLDVSGTPDDEVFNGEFDVDADDHEVELFSAQFPEPFDFDYEIVGNSIVLTSENDEPILETFFGIDLEVEEIILVLERA